MAEKVNDWNALTEIDEETIRLRVTRQTAIKAMFVHWIASLVSKAGRRTSTP